MKKSAKMVCRMRDWEVVCGGKLAEMVSSSVNRLGMTRSAQKVDKEPWTRD